ncbi:hypothetical protein Scep_023682 [Stephania cephalantha]|uniref:Uncharacterized protein n=1 Tax=Stephania cephalantha TaxID=152367 RepID=A0AAP0EY23_9MAGN
MLSARSRGSRASYAWEVAHNYLHWFIKISHPLVENPEGNTADHVDDDDDLLDRVRRAVASYTSGKHCRQVNLT